MARRTAFPVSPNPDINNLRQTGILLIKENNKEVHLATPKDIAWFWYDLHLDIDKDSAWAYVNNHLQSLNTQYIFWVTEWFMEWYRYMPDVFSFKMDGVGQVDWNIFFTLASPIPTFEASSFVKTIAKLNVWQTRRAKEQIKEDCWNNLELRAKLIREELIPSIYLEYVPYQTLRAVIMERQKKEVG